MRLAHHLGLAFLAVLVSAALPPLGARSAPAPPVSRNVTLHAHVADYPIYSACTAYVHPDGREYAVVGTVVGTSIVNVTNPSAPYEVGFIPGLTSQWREMKSYRQWIYVSTEAAGGGIQIVRMTDPEHPVLAGTYTGNFNRAHTVTVDTTRALLIANGTRLDPYPAGTRILSLEDPEHPLEIASYGADYVHDSWVRSDTLYAFCIQSGVARVFDFVDPYAPLEITSWSYPSAATHSGETSRDGRWLYVCDERNYSTMKVFDMASPYRHDLVHEVAVNPLAIVHNVHVKADTAFVAWYTEGVRLFDVADPSLPAEFGWYDTYGGFSGGFHGVWDVAHFPSGTFIASAIGEGLFVFRADPDYGTVKVVVRDGGGAPVAGADVVRLGASMAPGGSGGGDSTRTQARGLARLALAPGTQTLRVSKFGLTPVEIPVSVARGSSETVDVALLAAPSESVEGTIRRAGDLEPIPAAEATAFGTPLRALAAADGRYTLGAVPLGSYRLRVARAGYEPLERDVSVESGAPRDDAWELTPSAWYDSCDADRGWSLFTTGDHATQGVWERVLPFGTYAPGAPGTSPSGAGAGAGSAVAEPPRGGPSLGPQHEGHEEGVEVLAVGPVAPGADATPGGGGFCFVTGNGLYGGSAAESDVDGGRTTLTSPPLDLAAMDDPVIGYQRWYFMSSPGEPDSFLVEVSADGVEWVRARTVLVSDPAWRSDEIRVKDFVSPGAAVRIRFVAQDEGTGGVVEAGVDDIAVWDAATGPTSVPTPQPLPGAPPVLDAPRPNPTRGLAVFTLRLARPERARVEVYDLQGRKVATLYDGVAPAGALPLWWDGRGARGLRAASGVYWVRAEAAGTTLLRKIVRAR